MISHHRAVKPHPTHHSEPGYSSWHGQRTSRQGCLSPGAQREDGGRRSDPDAPLLQSNSTQTMLRPGENRSHSLPSLSSRDGLGPERSNSSLANSIQTLLDPSRSPPGAAFQGWRWRLSLRYHLGARDAKAGRSQCCPLGPARAPGLNITLPPPVLPHTYGLLQGPQEEERQTVACRAQAWVRGAPSPQQCPPLQTLDGADP